MTDVSPSPQSAAIPEGLGRLVLIGIAAGFIILPILVYFGIDLFGPIGILACTHNANVDAISCSSRQLVMTGMAMPVGAIIGFAVSYGIACRKFKTRGQ